MVECGCKYMESENAFWILAIAFFASIYSLFSWFGKINERGEKIPLKAKIFAGVFIFGILAVFASVFSADLYSLLWLIIRYCAVTSVIALIVLWLVFKFYRGRYEMDFKSQAVISLQTFSVFTFINSIFIFWLYWFSSVIPSIILSFGVAFYLAQKLFIKAGMDGKKEAMKITVPWFIAMIIISSIYMLKMGMI